jgi:hypothetical protein
MEYNFHGLCGDQLEKIEKRLESAKKSFMKEYDVALNIIETTYQKEHREEKRQDLISLFDDTKKALMILYASHLQKVMTVLARDL